MSEFLTESQLAEYTGTGKAHRLNGWTAAMLEGGYRPLLRREIKEKDDERCNEESQTWVKTTFPGDPAYENTDFYRTKRKLPDQYKPAEPPAVKADDDGWIPWSGGDCPVDRNALIQWKCRGDTRWCGGSDGGRAGDRHWGNHTGKGYDIIAYRLVNPLTPKEPIDPASDVPAGYRELRDDEKNGYWQPKGRYWNHARGQWCEVHDADGKPGCSAVSSTRIIVPIPAVKAEAFSGKQIQSRHPKIRPNWSPAYQCDQPESVFREYAERGWEFRLAVDEPVLSTSGAQPLTNKTITSQPEPEKSMTLPTPPEGYRLLDDSELTGKMHPTAKWWAASFKKWEGGEGVTILNKGHIYAIPAEPIITSTTGTGDCIKGERVIVGYNDAPPDYKYKLKSLSATGPDRQDAADAFAYLNQILSTTEPKQPNTQTETKTMATTSLSQISGAPTQPPPAVGSRWTVKCQDENTKVFVILASDDSNVTLARRRWNGRRRLHSMSMDGWKIATKNMIEPAPVKGKRAKEGVDYRNGSGGYDSAACYVAAPKKPLLKRIFRYGLSRSAWYAFGGLTWHLAASAILSAIAYLTALWAQHIAR